MTKIRRLIMLNQMAGPLFRELSEELASHYQEGGLLITGHPDTLILVEKQRKDLKIKWAPGYDRRSMGSRLFSWFRYLVVVSRHILFAKRTDGFLIASSPPILGVWFWLVNNIRRRPYTILVYDIYPDVLVEMGVVQQGNIIVKVWNWLNKKVYRDAESIVTLGKLMARRLTASNNLSLEKINIIPPWVDTDFIKPIVYENNPLARKFNPEGKHVVLYSGNMGISHDIDSLLGAAKRLRIRNDLLFLFIGGGDKYQTVVDYQASNQLDNIAVYPYQAESDLPHTMTLASISLVALDIGAQELMIPSKVFYYMAAGSAVIGICNDENGLRNVIKGAECGICVKSGSPQRLADEIVSLIDDNKRLDCYRKNARKAAISNYSRVAGVDQFISLFRKVGWIERINIKSIH